MVPDFLDGRTSTCLLLILIMYSYDNTCNHPLCVIMNRLSLWIDFIGEVLPMITKRSYTIVNYLRKYFIIAQQRNQAIN